MRIEQNLSQMAYSSLYSANQNHANTHHRDSNVSNDIKDTDSIDNVKKIEDSPRESIQENDNQESLKALKKERQTYGLLVLELMSDEEYAAFQRATAGMSEGEKIMAAQSLYTLSEFYQGRTQPQKPNPKNQNPYAKVQDYDDFIKKYQAFYNGAQNFDSLS